MIRGPADLGLEAVEQIAWGGASVALHPDALARVEHGRQALAATIAAGTRVYAVSTGAGYLGSVELPATTLAAQQRTLLLGRAVGGPPYLEPEEARAVLAVRLVNLVSGHAGVTPALCTFLADRLNDGFTPAIPRRSIGCAGEVIPLAHAFQTLAGVGLVLDGGGTRPAADALAARGVAAYEPAVKEGIALLAGAPAAVALAAARLRAARVLAGQLLTSAACAIDALAAPLDPYAAPVGELAGDPLLAAVLARLRALLEGSAGERRPSQAPISFRVIPQVLTHVERTVARLEEDTRRALAAVTDSPAVTDAGIVSTGGFHAVEVAAALDGLAAAFVRGAELAGQRLHRLLDARFSGLPDQLTPAPGPRSGLVTAHKRATGALHELRRLATPASVGLVDTSLGQEDALAFGFAAAENLRRIEPLVREVLACELLACRQAWWLRGRPPAGGLAGIAEQLTGLVAPVDEDRPLGEDVERLSAWLAAGRATRATPA